MSGRPGAGRPPDQADGPGRPGAAGRNRWQGGMMGVPVEKPKDFRGSFVRLIGRLRPEAGRIGMVIGLGVVSVATAVLGPRILGNATNIIFDGFISKQLPAGLTKEQVVASLRAQGLGQKADLVSGMHLHPRGRDRLRRPGSRSCSSWRASS